MNPPIISASYLTKRVNAPEGQLTILNDIHLEIYPHEAIAILGASGSGKSTLLGLLAGLDRPTNGRVELLGEDLNLLDEEGCAKLRAGQVGFIFQSFHLLPHLTALENVMLPMELGGHPQAKQIALETLKQVDLSHRLTHLPTQLSGGEQQRVAIARAFACRPRVLFADEPTGNLDQTTARKIIDLLFSLRSEMGTTLVLVTHDVQLTKSCDKHYQLNEGQIQVL